MKLLRYLKSTGLAPLNMLRQFALLVSNLKSPDFYFAALHTVASSSLLLISTRSAAELSEAKSHANHLNFELIFNTANIVPFVILSII
jgi:hypothetical protein